MEVVLAAALITRAVTEGGWYWWAGAILLAMLALFSLSVDLRTERKRRRPSDASMFVKRPPELPKSGR